MRLPRFLVVLQVCTLLISCKEMKEPLSLNDQNPHYFTFRGKPVMLIGSTEHYGAVLNLDFDYVKYLDELKANDLNVTRTFSGIYCEPMGAFGISGNTLAPADNKLICPWARSSMPGYINGGNKFDLDKWNEDYFSRLKDFITEAGKRDVVVELDLFSNFYDPIQWKLSPLYHVNNINNIGNVEDQKEVLSLRHPEILAVQDKVVSKIIDELKDMDNLYYEVCNEPYFGDTIALQEWQDHMTHVVVQAEKDFTHKHLVSRNVANWARKIKQPDNLVSIFNFHYAKPPVTVDMNYPLNRVIGDNETGFNGIEDVQYRTEAWDFLVAGGGLFNNLDYSFTVGHEDGTYEVKKGQPGGGGKMLRGQFKILAQTLKEFDFVSMHPHPEIIMADPGRPSVRVLADPGKEYLVYFNNRKDNGDTTVVTSVVKKFSIRLPAGEYAGTWINPITGAKTDFPVTAGGTVELETPPFEEDIALAIRKK